MRDMNVSWSLPHMPCNGAHLERDLAPCHNLSWTQPRSLAAVGHGQYPMGRVSTVQVIWSSPQGRPSPITQQCYRCLGHRCGWK